MSRPSLNTALGLLLAVSIVACGGTGPDETTTTVRGNAETAAAESQAGSQGGTAPAAEGESKAASKTPQ
jgi:hypothetical protein